MNQIERAGFADAADILELQRLAYQSEAAIYDDWSIPPLTQTIEGIEKEFTDSIFLKTWITEELSGRLGPRFMMVPVISDGLSFIQNSSIKG